MNTALARIGDGLWAPLEGLRVLRYPALWGLAWFPFLLGLGWALGAWSAAGFFAEGGIIGWAAGIGLMGLVVLLQILLALFSPLLDALSARAEPFWSPATEAVEESLLAGIWRALEEGLRLLVWKLGLVLLFSPLLLFEAGRYAWIPIAGFLIAVDFLDYPLSRRRMPFSQRKALFRRHAPSILAYASLCNVLLLTPGLGGLTLLPCVLGGTWLILRCLAHDAAPLSLTKS